ncbi:hypothetical protein ATO8_11254 [Roseivivax marinus]|uniref:DUF465 domain-containing protein n=1 Tax=Roseivivax marinus TaxID=1379903 RepID=W4HKD1_9RHOB|nr:DUF465 domain-containing protein [Roseivivax marinus]ETW12591.1 hypothetical protein ATO8_11254 [Roseivivax marinus]UMA65817.1 DUF465 domain-containing protein [Roseivivax marinus]SEL15486.1 hypothetical protein SAMN05444413_106117 [Roseivivax marinus]
MTHTPHRLAEDFPDHSADIAALRRSDAHFARLAEEYDQINDDIHLSEINVQPLEDMEEVLKRKERAKLKDAIYAMLTRARL